MVIKSILQLRIRILNNVLMAILPKLIYKFNMIPYQTLSKTCTEIYLQANPKIQIELKGALHGQKFLKKNKEGRYAFQISNYYKATLINTMWLWHEDRHIDQRNRIQGPEISLYILVNWLSTKVLMQFNEKKGSFFKKW